MIFSLELTHDVNALLPLLVGAVCAEAITVFTMKRSILTEKVARRGVHVAREYSVDPLELIAVRAVMHKDYSPIQMNATVEEVIGVYKKSKDTAKGYPVVDAEDAMQGFLQQKDIDKFIDDVIEGNTLVRDTLPQNNVITFPDEPLRVALDKMAESDSDCLPVVSPSDPRKVLGTVSRYDLFSARVLSLAEEKDLEKALSVRSFSTKRVIQGTRLQSLRGLLRNKKELDKQDE